MISVRLKRNCLAYAKKSAPYDTGNVRHNAIKGKHWSDKNKFTIHYSSFDAKYIENLEEKEFAGGSKTKKNKHKKFILKTYLNLANQLYNHYQWGTRMARKKRFSQSELENNDRRRLRHMQSIDAYKANREVSNNDS